MKKGLLILLLFVSTPIFIYGLFGVVKLSAFQIWGEETQGIIKEVVGGQDIQDIDKRSLYYAIVEYEVEGDLYLTDSQKLSSLSVVNRKYEITIRRARIKIRTMFTTFPRFLFTISIIHQIYNKYINHIYDYKFRIM